MAEHKTVFISYRRTNIYIARAVYQDLRANGYDVFLDYQSIDPGDFSQVILNQIAARAHFLLILTPSALERCVNSDDMVRREIEYAIDLKRNIVPLIFEGFAFKLAAPYLVSNKLKLLPKYSGLLIPDAYFEEAMSRLRTRFLNLPLGGVLHPIPQADQMVVQENIDQAESAPEPTPEQINGEEHFERGFAKSQQGDHRGAIEQFTQAIALNPHFSEAYYRRGNAYFGVGEKGYALQDWEQAISLDPNDRRVNIYRSSIYWIEMNYEQALTEAEAGVQRNPEYDEAYFVRGLARAGKDDYKGAIADFSEAIRFNSLHVAAYYNRGIAYRRNNHFDRAIADYTEAIRLNPLDGIVYNSRGIVRRKQGDLNGAIADFGEAIRLNPLHADAYYNRGLARNDLDDLDGTLADYSETIRLNSRDTDAYYSRGQARSDKGDLDGAIVDYEEVLRIDPDYMSAKKKLDLAQRMKKG